MTSQVAALNAKTISHKIGTWQYSHQSGEYMWPGGAVACAANCEADTLCMHWDFHCDDFTCHKYGKGGYFEEGDAQFGTNFMILGESSRWDPWVKFVATSTTTPPPAPPPASEL
mmetsp:Transcript_104045/g.324379  ORF Transcript_104045/g.324379 Transcript_104045/m.324379 type:complete len:114 (+) Transcript_104045:429-770(+)